MGTWENLLSWIVQTVALASVAALLPMLFRVRHPRTQLAWCHLMLAVCVVLPFVEPWRHPVIVIERHPEAAGDSDVPAAPPRSSLGGLRSASGSPSPAAPTPVDRQSASIFRNTTLWWILLAGAVARLGWLVAGLWQIRKLRIGATPLYPFPESVQAASSITHADAVFCVSSEAPGPVMLGWLAPVVLLPEVFLALGEEAQCGIACHELLHVRRHDWPVTLLEELAGALLWFNPGVWWLLAQARLAREQLVDAESVRLTAARESYIDALLAIARQRPLLDLAPAPLFLRRRHLTQRMHSLLSEVSMSKLRLLSSYCSMTAMLAAAMWVACVHFPLSAQAQVRVMDAAVAPADAPPASAPVRSRVTMAMAPPQQMPLPRVGAQGQRGVSVPIPPDPHEPVVGNVQTPATAEDRANALSLLEFAKANGQTHRAGSAPYVLKASFTASGSGVEGGSGELVESWLNGQTWRWTATMGNYSVARSLAFEEATGATTPGAVPMRVHMLRNAIFWAVQQMPSNMQVRTAAIQWNGQPATCLLTSRMVAPTQPTRLWEEEEYCVDNATKLLQVESVAPGTYVVYSYASAQFHGRTVPSRITIYVNGATVLDAQISTSDLGPVDPQTLRPTPEMVARGPVATLELPTRFPMQIPTPSVSGPAKPVIVHASLNGEGAVVEAEISSASDPALVQTALDAVRKGSFPQAGGQRQAYINVRFVPVQ
ncbi:MAG TPA: M56 family metallopeptidase [Bryobacteraceae bacterium]|nr:M56 family metallopeptidase [Bryobacteraceae bacterium]